MNEIRRWMISRIVSQPMKNWDIKEGLVQSVDAPVLYTIGCSYRTLGNTGPYDGNPGDSLIEASPTKLEEGIIVVHPDIFWFPLTDSDGNYLTPQHRLGDIDTNKLTTLMNKLRTVYHVPNSHLTSSTTISTLLNTIQQCFMFHCVLGSESFIQESLDSSITQQQIDIINNHLAINNIDARVSGSTFEEALLSIIIGTANKDKTRFTGDKIK